MQPISESYYRGPPVLGLGNTVLLFFQQETPYNGGRNSNLDEWVSQITLEASMSVNTPSPRST